ncbi:MAG: small basic protein [Candidatus Brocadiia bacterium]
MSIHPSLRIASGGSFHRNVLSKKERIAKLRENDKWSESSTVYGMPKIGNRKMVAKKKAKKTEE